MATRWRLFGAAAGVLMLGSAILAAPAEPQSACDTRSRQRAGKAGCPSAVASPSPLRRVRGTVRDPHGRPLKAASVDLVPIDVEPDATSGHVRDALTLITNERGEFAFTPRVAGRYHLGVSLYRAPNRFGPSYPRTYYPGTSTPAAATIVVVDDRLSDDRRFDFAIPAILAKGELEVVVEGGRRGRLELCFEQLENAFSGWTSTPIDPDRPFRTPIVDGQRYQVHVHVRNARGHFESQPQIVTATASKTVLRLHPDRPRALHP